MKTKLAALLVSVVLTTFAFKAFAIEGLTLSIQSSNVVLTWPSAEGETYIVQYRETLDTNSSWQTLTNFYPAAIATNLTSFVDSNAVCVPIGGSFGDGGVSEGPPIPGNYASGVDAVDQASYSPLPPLPPSPWDTPTWSSIRSVQTSASYDDLSEDQAAGAGVCHAFYRVVREGVNLASITNGQTISGVIRIPVEIATDNSILGLFLDESVEDAPPGIRAILREGEAPAFIWDSHRAPNGSYTLHPAVTFEGGSIIAGPSVTVVVSNIIQMPFRFNTFGGTLPINAEITLPDSDYQIKIRDDQGVIVRILAGTALGTVISNYWDGLDEGGSPVDCDFIEASISLEMAQRQQDGGGGTGVEPLIWLVWRERNVTLSGQWMIAHQNMYSGISKTTFENNMNSIVQFASSHGGVLTSSRFPIPTGAGAWNQFDNYLTQSSCRNLYYFGHGGPTKIGFGSNDSTHGLTSFHIGSELGNQWDAQTNGNLRFLYTARYPYRFVFLDGCSTAKEMDWLDAFAIPSVRATEADFLNDHHLSPRAYVGWKRGLYIAYGVGDSSRQTFVVNFFENWMENGEDLENALRHASNGTIGETTPSGFPALQIWGAHDLHSQ